MKVLLAAVNAKYIHSNLGIYSLKSYGEKVLAGRGFKKDQIQIQLAEYTINHQLENILKDLYHQPSDGSDLTGHLQEKAGFCRLFLLYMEYFVYKMPSGRYKKGASKSENLAWRPRGILLR